MLLSITIAFTQVMLYIFTSIVFDYGTPNARLITIKRASTISWVIYVAVIVGVFLGPPLQFDGDANSTTYYLVKNVLMMTFVTAWFAFDGQSMMYKMAVDEALQGAIFYYTDLFLLMLFVAVIMMSMMADGGGGAQFDVCQCDASNAVAPGDVGGVGGTVPAPVNTGTVPILVDGGAVPVVGDDARRQMDDPLAPRHPV